MTVKHSQRERPRSAFVAGIRRHSVLFAVALVAVGLGELALYVIQRDARNWQNHSRNVGQVARTALSLVLERDASIVHALVAPGTVGPGTRPDDEARLDSSLESLVALTHDNPAQNARARAIALAVEAWRSGVVDSMGFVTGEPREVERRDADLFAPVRTSFAEFLTAEDVLYDSRRDQGRLVALIALAAMLLPSGLLAGLVVARGRRFSAAAGHLADQQIQLEEQAVELEHQVQELEVANTELLESMESEREAHEKAEGERRERRRNAALLDAALLSAPVGISLLDRDLRYVMVNDAIAQITGIPPEEHVGRSLRDVNPLLSHDIEDQLRAVVETDTPIRNLEMIRATGPSGRLRYLLLNVYPIRTEDGDAIGLGVAAVDTTDQRELLEQFHHAQKLEAVGRLAAGIAHDFNNLLMVVCSYCDLTLLEMPEDAVWRDNLKEIRSAGERAATLSRQILGLSRKQVILPRALAVGDAIGDMKSMLHRVTGDNVVLRFAFNEPLGVVLIDPTHLEQVLMNLVINAVDAMPDGGEIFVTATNVTMDADGVRRLHGLLPGTHVAIAVRDTGTGIDDETVQRIFDPFFTTKEPGKGTGLGLSTVYSLVRDAGGSVAVDTELGTGTTFTVYLPADMGDEAARMHRESRPDPAALAVGKETVLVVEDEDSLRVMLTRVLSRRGYTVLEAAQGGEAMRVAAEHQGRIDLVLSDIHMPGIDGIELADRLREQRPELKVLFMSGSSGGAEGDRSSSSNLGVQHELLMKPFTVEALAAQIRRTLDS